MYNVVCHPQVINFFKKSKYFKTELGYSLTLFNEKKNNIEFNKHNEFGLFYKDKKKSICQKEGNVGPVDFYVDYYLKNNTISVWFKDTEFDFEFSLNEFKSKGVDNYLGDILNSVKESNTKAEKIKINEKPNPEKVFTNPGEVTYNDLKEYYKNKNKI